MGHCFLSTPAFLKTPRAAACLNQCIFFTSTPRGFMLTRVPDDSDADGDQTNSRKQPAWASPHTPALCQPWTDRQRLQGSAGSVGASTGRGASGRATQGRHLKNRCKAPGVGRKKGHPAEGGPRRPADFSLPGLLAQRRKADAFLLLSQGAWLPGHLRTDTAEGPRSQRNSNSADAQ